MSEIESSDVIFDDDIDVETTKDGAIKEINGYLWATKGLVDRTDWKPVTDCDQINFYPVLEIPSGKLTVLASMYENDKNRVCKLKLSDEETEMIKKAFITYICLDDCEAADAVRNLVA